VTGWVGGVREEHELELSAEVAQGRGSVAGTELGLLLGGIGRGHPAPHFFDGGRESGVECGGGRAAGRCCE
jgi:hypothetical protein